MEKKERKKKLDLLLQKQKQKTKEAEEEKLIEQAMDVFINKENIKVLKDEDWLPLARELDRTFPLTS